MAKKLKVFTITRTKGARFGNAPDHVYTQTGTMEELVKAYSYSLECGASWESEKGNKKINRNPKTN